MATIVGRDAMAAEGIRVVVTEEGRSWDMNKGKRGDPSGGASGSVVEVREGGKVRCVLARARGRLPCAPRIALTLVSRLDPPPLLRSTRRSCAWYNGTLAETPCRTRLAC